MRRNNRIRTSMVLAMTVVMMVVVSCTNSMMAAASAAEATEDATADNDDHHDESPRRRRRLSTNVPAAADTLKGLKIIVQTRDREEYKGWHKFSLEVNDLSSSFDEHPQLRGGFFNHHRRTQEQQQSPSQQQQQAEHEYTLHTLCRTKQEERQRRRRTMGLSSNEKNQFEDTVLSHRLKLFLPMGFDYVWDKFQLLSQPWNHPLLQSSCEHSGNGFGGGSSSTTSNTNNDSSSAKDPIDR